MKKYKKVIILINLLLLLLYFNMSVIQKEDMLDNGQLVLLRLAPVDPRSLMQGDYMELRYEIADEADLETLPRRGYFVVTLDNNGIAGTVRIQAEKSPLNAGEHLIKYTTKDRWNVSIGADSYFFQEGQADKFEDAGYGGVMIDENGNSVLVGLFDEELKHLK